MKNKKVAIIDYGMGNLFSVKLACESVGLEALITNNRSEVMGADAMILPGVGAFGDAINELNKLDLVEVIKDFIVSGKPFLGICLGMQLLMSESEEFGKYKGLDIIKGNVVKFPNKEEKVPQVGWNRIVREKDWENSLLDNVQDNEYMYFVHSFYCQPKDKEIILSETNYGGKKYCSSFQNGNVFACQFHPEKSGRNGLVIYENLKKLCQKKN